MSRQSSGGHAGSSTGNTAANSPTEESKKSFDDVEATKRDFNAEKTERTEFAEPSKLEQILGGEKIEEHLPCACWCQGWAEIYVRRPTGDMSWIMRIQNTMQIEVPVDFPVHDITTLYMPTPELLTNTSQETCGDFQTCDDVTMHASEQSQNETATTKCTAYSASSASVTSTSGPIPIPGSPARPSPSRQSSRDSLESLEEGDEGNYN